MASSKKLITNSHRLHAAKQIIESLNESANTVYYMFAGKHTDQANTSIPQPYDSISNTYIDVYQNMVFGKRIGVNDASLMIDRNDYVAGTTYNMYDDRAAFSNNSYVIVNAGTYYHVFKCLYNNGNTASTYEPNFSDTDATDELYETSDGYVWKYMYTVDNTKVTKFATEDYFPFSANAEVSNSAIDGAISVIKVENGGKGYNNYASGTFKGDELRIGSDLFYSIASSNNASSISGYYNGCFIKITDGAAEGRYAKIAQYTVNSTAKIIRLDSAFTTPPALNSSWEITPGVVIVGDSTQTVNAEARAIINSVSNTINNIEMLNIGQGYKYATATVFAADVVGVVDANKAELRPILSPYGGHGYNAEEELAAYKVCFSTTFANSTADQFLPSLNDYQQIGIIKDPIFDNVTIELRDVQGAFSTDETVYKMNPIRVHADGAAIVSGCTSVTSTEAEFERQFSQGEFIYITNDSDNQLAVVDSITSNTELVLTEPAYFSDNVKLYEPNVTSNGYITSSAVGSIVMTNVSGIFETDDLIIGSRSGAVGYVNSVSRNTVFKGFETFNQMYKYQIDVKSLDFVEDETIYQNDLSVANAVVHSLISGNTLMYVTNQIGNFNVANDIIGATSGAVATILNKYSPEVVFGSGTVLYIENVEPITRQPEQTETFKIILEF
jgi:hypothetical protein